MQNNYTAGSPKSGNALLAAKKAGKIKGATAVDGLWFVENVFGKISTHGFVRSVCFTRNMADKLHSQGSLSAAFPS